MSCTDFRVWHRTDMPTLLSDVRCCGQSGKHLLTASISPFDPKRHGLDLWRLTIWAPEEGPAATVCTRVIGV